MANEYKTWENEPETCTNCGRSFPDDQLTPLKNGWNFLACPECAQQCQVIERAESICIQALNEVLKCKTAGEMQFRLEAHAATKCGLCLEPRPVHVAMQGNLFQEVA